MSQSHPASADEAKAFASMHVPGKPVVIYNAWDAGSAKAIAAAGVNAIGTGSDSVAAAHGYPDGQAIPMEDALRIAQRIRASVDLPLTVDFEGAYAEDPEAVAANVAQLLTTGAVGLNFEDSRVGSDELYTITDQAARLQAIRAMADEKAFPLFINARCDVFLRAPEGSDHSAFMEEAIERGKAYVAAGASGLFVPLLTDVGLIAAFCEALSVPVNVMALPGGPSLADMTRAGAARVSHGPFPYREAMKRLTEAAQGALS